MGIFIILSLLMHQAAWFDAPLEHLSNVHNSTLGVYHPLYLSLFAYLIVWVIRKLWSLIAKRIKPKNSGE
ncbi:MAG: hypothetical protein JXK05_11100 [Campylobacterales bacterium]|nr:hypothetical protein [Campylobacterales bacterium]